LSHNRELRLLRRRVLAIGCLVLLAWVSSGRAAGDRTAKVVVITSGVVPEEETSGTVGYGYADYGLVLRNQSSNRDAINVTVEVEAVDSRDQSLADDYTRVTLIPAGSTFVVGGALIWRGSLDLAGIETEVHVGQSAPRHRTLPPVKHVSLTSSGSVMGSFTNPYKKPLPELATIYGVILDGHGRVVAAGYDLTNAVTRPRATAAFDILKDSTPQHREAARSARVSVDPCGYLAFTRDCPVPGAQS
jgi:hypothetical protein